MSFFLHHLFGLLATHSQFLDLPLSMKSELEQVQPVLQVMGQFSAAVESRQRVLGFFLLMNLQLKFRFFLNKNKAVLSW